MEIPGENTSTECRDSLMKIMTNYNKNKIIIQCK